MHAVCMASVACGRRGGMTGGAPTGAAKKTGFRMRARRQGRKGSKRQKTEQHSPNFVITNPDFVAHCDSSLPAGLFREKNITPSTAINFSPFPSDFFFGRFSAEVSSCCFVGTVSNRCAGDRHRPKHPSNTVRWDLCGSRNPGGGVTALARAEAGRGKQD